MNKKTTSFSNGVQGEMKALLFFKNKGFEIIEQRYRSPYGEIDLIIKKQSHYKAIEVKYRKKFTQLHEAISHKQLERIQNSILFYLQDYKIQYESISIDALLIYPPDKIIHIENCCIDSNPNY